MPIKGIVQPEFIRIDETLRLRKYDGRHDFALAWYQDEESLYMIDGDRTPYSLERVGRMYSYLDAHGELYFIEIREDGVYRPVGDVTFWQEDMPIVIGEAACRGRGIGRRVVGALIARGRELGYDRLHVGEIYDWNEASRRCFEAAGFRACKKTEKGSSFELRLKA